MAISEQELAIARMARRGEKAREALSEFSELKATISSGKIDLFEFGKQLEIGEKCRQELGKTFSWPNPYAKETIEYQAYEKVVASKRQAAIQHFT